MSHREVEITRKWVDDLLIAGLRFRGGYEEVPGYFERLFEQVGAYVSGKGILLHYYYDAAVGEGYDLEVCFPLSQAMETGEVESRILEGDEMLCAVHVGPHSPAGGEESVTGTVRRMWAYLRGEAIIPGSGPLRRIYLEDAQEHGDDAAQYVTELQIPYRFHRMERFAERLERFAGKAVRQEVMQGSEDYASLTTEEKAAWFKGAMARLDAAVEDGGTRSTIMNDCGERFPAHRIQMLRVEYQRHGDLDQILEIMRADRTLGELSWYEQPMREGNVVYVTKDPFLPEEYAQATDELEKRACYCHCGLMREAIRAGQTMSGTYCHCGAGWYRQLWEGIVEQPVGVEVLASVLQGNDRCSFAIHLPTGTA